MIVCPTNVSNLACAGDIPVDYDLDGSNNGTAFAALAGASATDNCTATADLDVSYSDTGTIT